MAVAVNASSGGIFRGNSDPNPTLWRPDDMNALLSGGGVAKASTGQALKIDVTARKKIWEGAVQDWNALSNQLLGDNTVTYVYLLLDSHGSSADPTVSTSLPGSTTNAWMLAKVTTSGGEVTEVVSLQELWPENVFSGTNSAKLAGIEALADVTDADNVAAAGAVMDADISQAEGFIRKTGAGAYEAIKSNLGASVAPDADDDSGDGYAVGSLWVDTTADEVYRCVDATPAAAVWKNTSGAGGGATDVDDFTHADIDAFSGNHVHCWPMTNLTGTTQEASVGSVDLEVTGTVAFAKSGPARRTITGDKGRYSVQILTSGANYLRAAALASAWGAGDFSISMWMRRMAITTASIATMSLGTSNNYMQIAQKGTVPGLLIQNNSGGDGENVRTTWMMEHIVVTRDVSSGLVEAWSNAQKIIVNASHDTNDYSSHDFYVARRESLSSDTNGLQGYYGEVNIWDTLIDEDCINALYNNGKGRFHG